jgi:stage II sporulation protein D
MRLAERACAVRALSLGLTGALVGSFALAAAPARADEVYVRASSTVTLSGHGYGHGHGMSQWGAYGAASVKKLSWQSILAFYYPGTKLADLGNPSIRVRLDVVGRTVLDLPAQTGLRHAGQLLPGTIAGAGITTYRVQSRAAAGLLIYARTSAGWKLLKTATAPAVFTSSSGKVDLLLASGARRAYRGAIVANKTSSTGILPVSVLPMESYLRAVVPAEMPASWHPNAVRSQAVAARSYANYDRTHATAGRTWDTCDTTSCQMYSGVPAESAASDNAVAATAGQTLTYAGKAAFTQFGSANGGWTSAGSQPYLPARADPYDGAIPNGANSWSNGVTASRIQARWPAIGTYRQLRIISRDGHGAWGGRVLSAAIDGTAGSVTVTGATIRSAFGLRSEWFVPSGGATAAALRDFNGDQKPDVLAVAASTGALWMYAGNGAWGWKSKSVIGTGFGGLPKVFTAGTWNADTSPDVMAQKPDGTLWLYPGSATGALSAGRLLPGSSWDMYDLIFPVGDFSGDGHPDLMARKPDGTLVLYCGDGAGGFVGAARSIGSGWGMFTAVLGAGDFTGDRKADVIARSTAGLLYLYPGNGSGGWLSPRLIGQGWNAFSAIISSGDFNGDGKSDLFGRGRDGALWVYPGNGAGGFLQARVVGTGWNMFSVILP